MKAASRWLWLMMGLSSAYERSTSPPSAEIPIASTYGMGSRFYVVHKDVNDYMHFQEFIGRIWRPQQPLPYLLSARIYLHGNFLDWRRSYQLKWQWNWVYGRNHLSASTLYLMGQLMSSCSYLMFICMYYVIPR